MSLLSAVDTLWTYRKCIPSPPITANLSFFAYLSLSSLNHLKFLFLFLLSLSQCLFCSYICLLYPCGVFSRPHVFFSIEVSLAVVDLNTWSSLFSHSAPCSTLCCHLPHPSPSCLSLWPCSEPGITMHLPMPSSGHLWSDITSLLSMQINVYIISIVFKGWEAASHLSCLVYQKLKENGEETTQNGPYFSKPIPQDVWGTRNRCLLDEKIRGCECVLLVHKNVNNTIIDYLFRWVSPRLQIPAQRKLSESTYACVFFSQLTPGRHVILIIYESVGKIMMYFLLQEEAQLRSVVLQ